MGVIVVLGFAFYMKLPLTTVYIVCLAALAFSIRALPEPFNSLLNLLRIPAQIVQAYGQGFGLSSPAAAAICLACTFVFDMAVTSALGWRSK
jgi:hypothetical protein